MEVLKTRVRYHEFFYATGVFSGGGRKGWVVVCCDGGVLCVLVGDYNLMYGDI